MHFVGGGSPLTPIFYILGWKFCKTTCFFNYQFDVVDFAGGGKNYGAGIPTRSLISLSPFPPSTRRPS